MKKLLLFLSFTISFATSFAQTYQTTSNYGLQVKRIKADSVWHPPYVTSSSVLDNIDLPAIAVRKSDTSIVFSTTGISYNYKVLDSRDTSKFAVPNIPTSTTYGDATHIPSITFDSRHRISGVTVYTVSGGGSPQGLNDVITVNPVTSNTITATAGGNTSSFSATGLNIGVSTNNVLVQNNIGGSGLAGIEFNSGSNFFDLLPPLSGSSCTAHMPSGNGTLAYQSLIPTVGHYTNASPSVSTSFNVTIPSGNTDCIATSATPSVIVVTGCSISGTTMTITCAAASIGGASITLSYIYQ